MKNILLFSLFFTFGLICKGQTVSDIDGNIYNTVNIGTQIWMKENLKVIKYNDGTSIPLETDSAAWTKLNISGYCWFNNDAPQNKDIYGALYNWYTVNSGKLCPTGWHIPTANEWKILTDYLGGTGIAGGKLKEAGTTHWNSPNTGATNESNFTALPSGARLDDGSFFGIGLYGFWWSSDSDGTENAWYRRVNDDDGGVDGGGERGGSKKIGISVRCLSDNVTSIDNLNTNNLEIGIYPNPSNGKLFIKNINTSKYLVEIYNLQGELHPTKQINSNSIDISSLSNGVYFVKINNSEKIKMIKLIKE